MPESQRDYLMLTADERGYILAHCTSIIHASATFAKKFKGSAGRNKVSANMVKGAAQYVHRMASMNRLRIVTGVQRVVLLDCVEGSTVTDPRDREVLEQVAVKMGKHFERGMKLPWNKQKAE